MTYYAIPPSVTTGELMLAYEARPRPVSFALPDRSTEVDQHAKPANYDRIVTYMKAVPGVSWEAAQSAVNDPANQPKRLPPTPAAVVCYLRQHPGMSYERAEQFLTYGR